MSVGVIIAAGGSGRRMGSKRAKQFLKIKGVPVIDRTLSLFDNHKAVTEIVVVLPKAEVASQGKRLRNRFRRISAVVAGGQERTHSVQNGFRAFLKKHSIILVHDAVRPFVRPIDITNVIKAAKKYDGVTLAVPVKDTIKIVNGTRILGTPNRKTLWHTLTPQGFKTVVLKDLLDYASQRGKTGTDECMIAEKLGKNLHVVPGDYFNIKITTPEDLILAEAISFQTNRLK